MRIFNISSAAEKALSAALSISAPARPAPAYTVRAASGTALDAVTVTGAFKALRLLSPRDRDTARIYDEDGWCLYR